MHRLRIAAPLFAICVEKISVLSENFLLTESQCLVIVCVTNRNLTINDLIVR